MRKMMKSIAAVLAVSALMAGSAFAAEKLAVKAANGSDTVFAVSEVGQLTLGTTSFTPDSTARIHIKEAKNGVVALRVENPSIFGASAASAQENFVLGPSGAEHMILQVLSDSHTSLPNVALINAYTHDFYLRTNAQNVVKMFRTGAVADTLTLKTGLVGIGTASPTTKLHVSGDTIRIDTPKASMPTATCNTGEIAWDSAYIYVCTSTNTWKKAALN